MNETIIDIGTDYLDLYHNEERIELTDDDPDWMHMVAYLESGTVGSGQLQGEPFICYPWQVEIVKAIMEYSFVAVSVARGNGKTALLGSILSAFLIHPRFKQANTEIPIVASQIRQAAYTVEHARNFIQPEMDADPDWIQWNTNQNAHALINRYDNIKIEAVSADPRARHGAAPPIAGLDEPAKWSGNNGERVFNAMMTGRGKQKRNKIVVIGTRPESPEHWFSKALVMGRDKRVQKSTGMYSIIHASDPDAEFDDVEQIKKANPMWDYMPELRKTILEEMEMIKKGMGNLAMFKALRMNQGTPEDTDSQLLFGPDTRAYWEACEVDVKAGEKLPHRRGDFYLGIDLGMSKSLTCASLFWPQTGRLEVYSAICKIPDLKRKGEEDGIPGVYEAAERAGHLKVMGLHTTAVGEFLDYVKSKFPKGKLPVKIISDRRREPEFKQWMMTTAPEWRKLIEPRAVGKGEHGTADIEAFQRVVCNDGLRVEKNILMRNAVFGTRVVIDSNQNRAIDKKDKKTRIDPIQSSVVAVAEGWRSTMPEVYDGRGPNIEEYFHIPDENMDVIDVENDENIEIDLAELGL